MKPYHYAMMQPEDQGAVSDQSSRVMLESRRFRVERVTSISNRTGQPIVRDIVRHPGAVVIVPILNAQTLVLIRNRRIAVGTTLWEFPAGLLESGEAPYDCAVRELREETGYQAQSLVPLGTFYTTPGLTDERMHIFAAFELSMTVRELEAGEEITVETSTAQEVFRMLDDGTFCDGKSIIGLLLAQRQGYISV